MPDEELIDIQEYKRTVTLMDDDFMSLCLNDCIPCTQVIINIILGRKDIHVKRVETQKFYQGFGRSLKIDVFAEDESGKLYNIIFITRNDVFGFGDMLYRIERYIEGRNERFDDGQHIIYVNCSADEDGSELWKLIHDMNCDDPDEMFIPEIADRTGYFINTEEGEMTMNAYLAEVMKKREEATERRMARNFALRLLEAGKETFEEIASLTGLALAEVMRLARMREGLSE